MIVSELIDELCKFDMRAKVKSLEIKIFDMEPWNLIKPEAGKFACWSPEVAGEKGENRPKGEATGGGR